MSDWQAYEGSADAWDAAIQSLCGSSFYQCHAWGEVKRRQGWRVLRLRAKHGMAQVLLRRFPLGLALAWIPGGPVGNPVRWSAELPDVIANAGQVRFLYLRLNALQAETDIATQTLIATGWRAPSVRLGSGLSLVHNLAGSAAERLALVSGNWRHNLKRSGKYGLRVSRWEAPDSAVMSAMYRALESHKGLAAQISQVDLASYVELLGEHMVLLRCDDADGQPLALRAAAVFGDTAWDLLAAATPAARKVYASHATLWALLEACSERGAVHYDLGGVDPQGNKGVFDFKQGIGARLIRYQGEWEWASNPLVRIAVNAAIQWRGMQV